MKCTFRFVCLWTLLVTVVCSGFATAREPDSKKLQVFILAGQSNMVGHANYITIPRLFADERPEVQKLASLVFKEGMTVTRKTVDDQIATRIERDKINNDLRKKVIEGELKVVFVLGNPFENELEFKEIIKRTQLVIHIGVFHNSWSEMADVVLPGQFYSEKEGTYTNKNQRVQSTEIAVKALRRTRPEWQIISELSQALGHKSSFESIPQVFNAMALEAKAFTGISFDKIGGLGIELTKNTKDPGKKVVPEMTAI